MYRLVNILQNTGAETFLKHKYSECLSRVVVNRKHYIEVNVLLLHQIMYLIMVFHPKVRIMMLFYIPKAILRLVTLYPPPVINLLQQDLQAKMVMYIKLKPITT